MTLRPLELKDISGMLEWMHDDRINCFFRFPARSMTAEKAEQFIINARKDADEKKNYHFAVVDESDRYLGTISLKEIDWEARTAEYAVCLRKSAQGHGIALKATQEILAYAFTELGLNKVFLNVMAENDRAVRLYEKAGFLCEGEFREHICKEGVYSNLKWYGMLKEEYDQNVDPLEKYGKK